jgi:hypothetical protein
VEYLAGQHWGIQVRYVKETYKLDGYRDIVGSHAGIGVRYYF